MTFWLVPLRPIASSTDLLKGVYITERKRETPVIYKPVSVLVMAGAGQGNDHK